jgi:hypothetical protein
MIGSGCAEYQRTVAARQGRVFVSKAQKSNKFETAYPCITPTTRPAAFGASQRPLRCLNPKILNQLAKTFY